MTTPKRAVRQPGNRRDFLRASMSVGAWTLISRATGFIRLAAIGAVLGPTFLGNLFQTANQLPNLAFELVAGQLIASLLMPALVGHLDADDRTASERLAGGFLGLVLALFAAVAIVITAAGPVITRLLGLGVADASIRQDITRLGWPLLAVVMPQLALYGFIGVANAVQNARHRFGLAAAAPVVENLVVVGAVVVFRLRTGGGSDLANASYADVLLLGVGSTCGVALHAAVQWWGAHRVGVRLRPRAGWRDAEVRSIVRLAIPSLGLAGLNAAQTFGCLIVVGSVAGGVVAFQLGLAFVATAVALGARPLTVAALPDLSRLATSGDLLGFRRHWDRTLGLAVFLLAPIAIGLSALAPALGRLLGIGAMSSDAAIGLVAAAVVGLSVAVLGDGVTSFTTQAAYALRDAKAPLQAALIRTFLLTAGLGLTMRLHHPSLVVLGAGIAFSLGSVLSAWYLCRSTEQRLPGTGTIALQVRRGVLLAAAAGLPALAVSTALTVFDGPIGRVAPAAGGGLVLGTGYLLFGRFMTTRYGWPSVLSRGSLQGGRADATAAEAPVTVTLPDAAPAGPPTEGPQLDRVPRAVQPEQAAPASAAPSRSRAGRTAGTPAGARLLQSLARPTGLLLLVVAALGPATVVGNLRWLAITSAIGGVLLAAARPRLAALSLALVGPLTSAFDLHRGTAATASLAVLALIGTSGGAALARVRGAHRRRIRLGSTGWASVAAAGFVALGVGLVGNEVSSAIRLAITVVAATMVFVSALDPLRDLRIAARYALSGAILGLPVYLLLILTLAEPSRAVSFVGLLAAPIAGVVGLALVTACRRGGASPGPAALSTAVALGACGGWVAVAPMLISVWLVRRHWPGDGGQAGADAAPSVRPARFAESRR